MSTREINSEFGPTPETSGETEYEDDATVIRRSREHDARVKAAHIEYQRRLAEGSASESLRAILWDPEIPEELSFEVMLMELADRERRTTRMPPFEVYLAGSAERRRVMRALGMRIPPPAERRAWEEWRWGRGPRPDRKPEESRS